MVGLPACGTAPATNATNWCDGVAAPCLADGKQNMGALFNLNMLQHEPGAFAHNRYYTKRLIYDSIDWLDDKAMNKRVGATLPTLLTGTTLTEAQGYIIKNGTRP